jgi:hypothetical protein
MEWVQANWSTIVLIVTTLGGIVVAALERAGKKQTADVLRIVVTGVENANVKDVKKAIRKESEESGAELLVHTLVQKIVGGAK